MKCAVDDFELEGEGEGAVVGGEEGVGAGVEEEGGGGEGELHVCLPEDEVVLEGGAFQVLEELEHVRANLFEEGSAGWHPWQSLDSKEILF